MEANKPWVFIKGIDVVIKRDLEKHKELLTRSQIELEAYHQSRAQLIKRKKHYRSLLGGEKYDDTSISNALDMMVIDIRQMSDKIDLTHKVIEHHTLIVDTLAQQLKDYDKNLAGFNKHGANY